MQGLLGLAGRADNPDNPTPVAAQQTVTTNTPPAPPQPKQPPVPHVFVLGFFPDTMWFRNRRSARDTTCPPTRDNFQRLSTQLLLLNPTGQPAQPGNGTTINQVHPRPGTGVPPVSRGTMPDSTASPTPNGPDGPANLALFHLRREEPLVSPAGHTANDHGDSPAKPPTDSTRRFIQPGPRQLAPGSKPGRTNEDVHDKRTGRVVCAPS